MLSHNHLTLMFSVYLYATHSIDKLLLLLGQSIELHLNRHYFFASINLHSQSLVRISFSQAKSQPTLCGKF